LNEIWIAFITSKRLSFDCIWFIFWL